MQDKLVQQGIDTYEGSIRDQIEYHILHRIAENNNCSVTDVDCYEHSAIGEEVITVRGNYVGYLSEYEENRNI